MPTLDEYPNSSLEQALLVALQAHQGQVDKGGAPYILHPIRLCINGKSDDERLVGLLHDVLEDSDITFERIDAEFGSTIAEAVAAMTKREGEDYPAFIARCARNPLARAVKLLDLADNMDTSRLPAPLTEKDQERLRKYSEAEAQLRASGIE